MLDQSNHSTQRCRLIFWVESSVGGYLALAKPIVAKFSSEMCFVNTTIGRAKPK
jgi:hypothetical protein